jgi:EamA domain-containing membrane protein RarD
MVAGIFALNYILFREGNAWLSKGKDLVGFQRWFLILTIFSAQVAAGFAFDWNQLIEGIGQLPNIVGTLITVLFLVGIGLRVHNKQDNYEKSANSWKKAMIIAWAALVITVLLILFVFQNGIKL